MANLQAATLTIPTNVEGTVTPVTYDLKDATARAGAVELVKDTAGWIGGNKQPSILANMKASNTSGTWNNNVYEKYGVTFTVNSDGSITMNGTATSPFTFDVSTAINNPNGKLLRGKYVVAITNSVPSGGNYSIQKNNTSKYWDLGSNEHMTIEFTNTEYWSGRTHIYLNVNSVWNNVTIYPLMYAENVYNLNPAYRPYHSNVVNILREAEVIEGKNLLPYPYYDKGNKTDATIKFIDNGNGTITVKAGTATDANAQYFIVGKGSVFYADVEELRGKILSSGVSTNTNIYLRVWYYDASKNYLTFVNATEEGILLDIPADAVYYVLVLRIDNNTTVQSDTVVKPMLRLATETDPTYEPYYVLLKDSKADKTEVQTAISLLDDTVGWVGKNKNKFKIEAQTAHGVTITRNADDTYTLTGVNDSIRFQFFFLKREGTNNLGLPAGIYTLVGGDSQVSVKITKTNNNESYLIAQSNGNAVEFDYDGTEAPYGFYFEVQAPVGTTFNKTISALLTTPEQYALSPTYEPYHESVEEYAFPRSEQAVLGAKNIIINNAVSTGIFTVNADKTVTVNSTSSSASYLQILDTRNKGLNLYKGLTLKVSKGTVKPGTALWINTYNGSTQVSNIVNIEDAMAESNPITFDYDGYDGLQIGLTVTANTDATGEVFTPMISFDGGDYVAPAMTNRELTEKVGNSGTYDLYMIANALTPANGAQPEFFIPWNNPELKTPTFSFTIRIRNNSAWETLAQSGNINIQKVCKNGFLVNASLTDALTSNSQFTFRIDGTITF